jgi:NAD(P)H-nitrite reductase large subunit
VTLAEIKKAIEDGASTVSGIKKRTRACMGMCQGRVCQPLVREVLAQQPGEKEKDIGEATSRAPVRPVLIGDII